MVEEELDEEYRDDSLLEETSTQEIVEAVKIIEGKITAFLRGMRRGLELERVVNQKLPKFKVEIGGFEKGGKIK